MPFSHAIDRAHGIVFSRLWGTLTPEEIDEHRRRIRADPAFGPELSYLVDMRGLTGLAYSCAKVRQVAATQIFRGPQRRAIVATTDEQYGVARMFATLAALEGERVEPFRDWASAAEWLGLSGEHAADPGPPVATV